MLEGSRSDDSTNDAMRVVSQSVIGGHVNHAVDAYLFTAILTLGMILTWYWTTSLAPRLQRYVVAHVVASTAYIAVVASFVFVFLQVRAQFIYFQF